MQVYEGEGVCKGIAIGKLALWKQANGKNPTHSLEILTEQEREPSEQSLSAQWMRFEEARKEAFIQLDEIYEKAKTEIGEKEAAVFQVHQMLLEDQGYEQKVKAGIWERWEDAETAVEAAQAYYVERFLQLDDAYMRERAADIQDISGRLLRCLRGEGKKKPFPEEPSIVAAKDLSPSEVMEMEREKILAFVFTEGTPYSHAMILAKTMGIPALIHTNLNLMEEWNGTYAVADGEKGLLYVEPDAEFIQKMQQIQKEMEKEKEDLQLLKGEKNETLDGVEVKLLANVGNLAEAELALEMDAGGIGLFRSEFLFLEKDRYPTEEEQFLAYKQAAELMKEKPVVIRTLDLGADKKCAYVQMEQEENPALGMRGIRFCLARPEIFRTQLRALLRAAKYGKISIMYPMITNVWEVQRVKELVEEVKEELKAEGVSYGNPRQGIMIETPAAVMLSEELAEQVDFFSIGTNDLSQYTMAVDRQNSKLKEFYDPHHPAVLRMIHMVVKAAHKAGIPVGICGELGADEALTQWFLSIGADSLSVSPEAVLPLRKKIRTINLGKYEGEENV